MKLKVKILKFLAGKPVCMIHKNTAKKMSIHVSDRVSISRDHKKIISAVDTAEGILKLNEIAVSEEIITNLNLRQGSLVEVKITSRPHSITLIKKKLLGKTLAKEELEEIVDDIANNSLTEIEIAFFISSVYNTGFTTNETKNFIGAMIHNSNIMTLRGKIVDKHCIGGVAGNRTTPIVVSICAAAGLTMPKNSSRAITSAAGTADVIETLANVDFNIKEVKKIITKTKACFIWGGGLGFVPVDSKIIKIERMIHVDSNAQMIASILSKKIAVDSEYILIDIPYGPSAKVTKRKAEKLSEQFIKIGKYFNLKIKVVLTNGKEPIGRGIGPVLEMTDVLKVLGREDPPQDLEQKSLMLAGTILEMAGKAKKGKGIKLAEKILYSGKAFNKFKQIIKAQGGKIKPLERGKYSHVVYTRDNKKIKHIDNKLLNTLARFAGCPEDKAAGIYLHKKAGESIEKESKIMTIYAMSQEKLDNAMKFYNKNKNNLIKFY